MTLSFAWTSMRALAMVILDHLCALFYHLLLFDPCTAPFGCFPFHLSVQLCEALPFLIRCTSVERPRSPTWRWSGDAVRRKFPGNREQNVPVDGRRSTSKNSHRARCCTARHCARSSFETSVSLSHAPIPTIPSVPHNPLLSQSMVLTHFVLLCSDVALHCGGARSWEIFVAPRILCGEEGTLGGRETGRPRLMLWIHSQFSVSSLVRR